MAKAPKKSKSSGPGKRVRPRSGYVMVELSEAERRKVEALRDKQRAETGMRATLSSTIRKLILDAEL